MGCAGATQEQKEQTTGDYRSHIGEYDYLVTVFVHHFVPDTTLETAVPRSGDDLWVMRLFVVQITDVGAIDETITVEVADRMDLGRAAQIAIDHVLEQHAADIVLPVFIDIHPAPAQKPPVAAPVGQHFASPPARKPA